MQLRRMLLSFALLAIGLTSGPRLDAQGTDLGAIRGTVTDSSGARIPNAKVQVIDLTTQIKRTLTGSAHGNFEAAALPSGKYRVSVTAPGFGTSIVENVTLTGSDSAIADVTLRPTADTSVSVTSEASLIDTEDSTLSESLTPTAIIELPRDSRDIYSFMYLNPNVSQSGVSGDFKFIGAQSYGAAFSVDGQRSNGGIFGSATKSEPSLESVGEFNVLSNGFSAEYAGIASIRISTRRGGSVYHGSLFYNNKNSGIAAWTLADKTAAASFAPSTFQPHYPNPFFNITDAGGSAGGAIPHLKKTFFFAAYEHDWTVKPSSTGRVNTLPHPSLIAGNFSGVADANKPVVPAGTSLSAGEIATDTVGGLGLRFITIPSRLLNPTVQKLFSLYYPQIGVSAPMDSEGRVVGFQTAVPGRSGQNLGDLRIDHDFSDSNRLYGVYHAGSENDALTEVASPILGLGLSKTDRRNNTVSLSYTHLFNQHIINEARGGFNRQYLYTHSNTTLRSFLASAGFTNADIASYGAVVGPTELDTDGQAAISITNFTGVGTGGRNTNRPLSQNLITFGDTLTWSLGRHNIRAGADFVRNAAQDGFTSGRGDPRGLITYSGSGDTALGNLLLGNPPTTVSTTPLGRPAMNVYNWESGYFVQDDFRINARWTLNLGLRYDLYTPFTEVNDLMVNFDPDLYNPVSGTLGVFIMPSAKTLAYIDPAVINFGYVFAPDSGRGIGRSLVQTDKTDVNPRIGAAYRLTSNSVIRGGYGLFTPASTAHVIRDPLATNTFNQTVTIRNSAGNPPLQGWPVPGGPTTSPNAGGASGGFGNTPTANLVPYNLKNPRLQQWNATFEQQLPYRSSVRFSYIGSFISGETTGRDLEMIAPSDDLFGVTIGDGVTICDPANLGNCAYSDADAARLRFPALGDDVIEYGNNGHGLTASFQAQVQRQTRGFTLSIAYTYLHQNSSGVDSDNDSLGGGAYNQLSPDSDYGPDSFVSHHRVVAYGVFDVPVGRGLRYGGSMSRLMDGLIGGWQGTFNMFAKTGTGFTPFYYCNDCDPVIPGNIASSAIDAVGDFSGGYRAKVIGNVSSGTDRTHQWNPAAFTTPDVGSTFFSDPANAKHNSLLGPGTWGVNLGVHKSFALTDRIALQLGADADNVFNHPLLSPDSNTRDDFSNLGNFTVHLDPNTGAILPLMTEYYANPDFGLKYQSVTQEGVDNRRSIRLRGRVTF